MTGPTEDVYEAAARARMIAWGYQTTMEFRDFEVGVGADAENAAFRAAVDSAHAAGVAAGRAQAAADIRAAGRGVSPMEAEWAAKIAGGEPRG